MKHLFVLSSLLLTLSFSACEQTNDTEEKGSSLQLQFLPTYDGQPIAMFQKVPYSDGSSLFFDRFHLFLSDWYLVNEGISTPLFDVRRIDFESIQDVNAAQKGVQFRIDKLPVGTFTGLKMGIGLSPAWNATKPSDYTTTHPLANNYWEQWNSYISMALEGKADTLGNGVSKLSLTYHIGKNPAYSEKNISIPITLKSGETQTIVFEIDLKKLLVREGTYLDIRKTPIDHSTDPFVYDFIRTNIPNALTVKNK
jgi:hypothetical protein